MICPKCGLENPDTAMRCDCGFDFTTDYVPVDRKTIRRKRDIASIKRFGLNALSFVLSMISIQIARALVSDYGSSPGIKVLSVLACILFIGTWIYTIYAIFKKQSFKR